jgi:predicted transcriptional regulator
LEVNNIAEFKKVIDLSVKMVNNPNEIKQAYLGFIEAGDVGYTLRTVDSLQNEILLKVQK